MTKEDNNVTFTVKGTHHRKKSMYGADFFFLLAFLIFLNQKNSLMTELGEKIFFHERVIFMCEPPLQAWPPLWKPAKLLQNWRR